MSDFLLHLHTEKHLAISTIPVYQMAIANTLRATSGSRTESCTEVATLKYRNGTGTINVIFQRRNLILVLLALIKPPFEPLDQTSDQLLTWKTVFLIALASGKRRGEIHAFEHARLQWTCHSYQRCKYWSRARNVCFHARFQHLTVI